MTPLRKIPTMMIRYKSDRASASYDHTITRTVKVPTFKPGISCQSVHMHYRGLPEVLTPGAAQAYLPWPIAGWMEVRWYVSSDLHVLLPLLLYF